MEAYKKVGRGGAGNFWSKKDVVEAEGKGKGRDIEAQPTSTSTSTTSAQPPPEYLHTGRGGAGNWVQPTELISQGLAQRASPNPTDDDVATPPSSSSSAQPRARPGLTSSSSSSSSIPKSVNIPSSTTTTARYRGGRGGAGNYSVPESPAERERKARLERAAVDERIRLDVDAGLAKPPRAYGGVGGSWEMGPVVRKEEGDGVGIRVGSGSGSGSGIGIGSRD
ncbi:hypothetical protein PVAG01_05429 [Phlyctema vagabunda]|uniref:Uncharacterized protein n=1 Tax=Phlyctema vagabunda TaxID=108571 RepID=A0ABR4PKS2_9HELO